MLWATMGGSFGSSPWIFRGFMMGGLALSLILSLFIPNTKNVSQYDDNVGTLKTSLSELKGRIDEYINYYNGSRKQWNLKKMTPAQYRSHLIAA
jgi:hypothetical protein